MKHKQTQSDIFFKLNLGEKAVSSGLSNELVEEMLL